VRLDRVNLAAIEDVLKSLVEEALSDPGKVARLSVPTSPSDGVQVWVRAPEGKPVILAIRRPGGKEDPREILALARHMGLVPVGEPEVRRGKDPRPPKGPRAYLVLECQVVPKTEYPTQASSGSPGQAGAHEDAQKPDQESIRPQGSIWASTHTPLKPDEVEARLRDLGYRFSDWSRYEGATEVCGYVLETDTVHLAPWLPVERIYQGLSDFEASDVVGDYYASVTLKAKNLAAIAFSFRYTFRAKLGNVSAEVSLRGSLDAPFPHGQPTEHTVSARLFVGPVPMGKGQKARARQAVEEALRAIPSFVHHFPDAEIVALLETRGGRGGWKSKVAHHDMGRVKRWLTASS